MDAQAQNINTEIVAMLEVRNGFDMPLATHILSQWRRRMEAVNSIMHGCFIGVHACQRNTGSYWYLERYLGISKRRAWL